MDMAGNSADDVARAAREKAERLLRRAERFERGAEGERTVAALLAQLPPDWFVLNDLHWPGRDRANIDHVVVGPTGVFVIDAKNWSGALKIANGVLRQNGYSRKSATDGVMEAARVISSLIPWVNPRDVVPVLCLVGAAKANGTVDGVRVCTAESLLQELQGGRTVLAADQREFLRYDLDMSTDNARESTAHRRRPVTRTQRAHPTRRVTGSQGTRRRATGGSAVARVLLALIRVVASFLVWAVACALASVAVGLATNFNENASASAGLLVGGLCGWLAWRRLSPDRLSPLGLRP